MKTVKYLTGSTLLTLLVFWSLAPAQRQDGPRQRPGIPPPAGRPDGPRGPRPPRPGHGGALDFASVELLGGGRLVKGLPYTAEAVSELTQTLGDGTSISRKSSMAVARDGEGRLRRERIIDSIGPFSAGDGRRTLIVIDDPTLGSHFVLDVENKRVRKVRNPQPPAGGRLPGDVDDQRGEFADGKVESLGKKSIEGIEAEGTRATVTIPVGEIGNDRVIEIVSERWFSPELQVVVQSKHSDPRMGDTIYRLTNIKRTEPDAALFKIPADYKMLERQPPPPRRPGGPGMRPPRL